MKAKRLKNLFIITFFAVVFFPFSLWVKQQGPEIFLGYIVVAMIIINLVIWIPFKKKPRYSGLLDKWIPVGFSIKYEGAHQEPLLNLTDQNGDKWTKGDMWVNVFFGNATVSINLQSRVVTHSYPSKPDGIKLLVKDGDKILLNIGY